MSWWRLYIIWRLLFWKILATQVSLCSFCPPFTVKIGDIFRDSFNQRQVTQIRNCPWKSGTSGDRRVISFYFLSLACSQLSIVSNLQSIVNCSWGWMSRRYSVINQMLTVNQITFQHQFVDFGVHFVAQGHATGARNWTTNLISGLASHTPNQADSDCRLLTKICVFMFIWFFFCQK